MWVHASQVDQRLDQGAKCASIMNKAAGVCVCRQARLMHKRQDTLAMRMPSPCPHPAATAATSFLPPLAAEHSSSEGWLVLDKFSFPDGGIPIDVTFGCETRETGEIYKQAADGILGMGNNVNALHSQVGLGVCRGAQRAGAGGALRGVAGGCRGCIEGCSGRLLA